MARIDYSISVTAIGTASGEGQTVDVIDQRVNRTLSGGNSSKVWVGTDTTGWSTAGVPTHVEAIATPAAVGADGDNMIWIKHTGKQFDSGAASSTDRTTTVVVYVAVTHTLFNAGSDGSDAGAGTANIAIAELEAGESMVIPEAQLGILVGSAESTGTAPAVEYAKLT